MSSPAQIFVVELDLAAPMEVNVDIAAEPVVAPLSWGTTPQTCRTLEGSDSAISLTGELTFATMAGGGEYPPSLRSSLRQPRAVARSGRRRKHTLVRSGWEDLRFI